jgi:WD40 repeat protein
MLWKFYFQRLSDVFKLVFVLILGSVASVQSATVSGIVFQQDGTTRITDTDLHVGAYSGDPCLTFDHFINGVFNSTDGTFIVEIPDGTYYLWAFDTPGGNYLLEWWTPDGSSPKCSDAVPISIIAGSKDFQLSVAQAGDVNRDGDISLLDATITLQNLTGQNDNPVWLSGDVNDDGRIGLPEVIQALRVISDR